MKNALLVLSLFAICATANDAEPSAEEEESAWSHSSSLGVTVSGGNSNAQSYQAKAETAYKWQEKNTFKNTLRFLYGENNAAPSARNWAFNLRYERAVNKRLGMYVANGYDGDTFAGFDWRASAGLGARYFIYPEEKKHNYLVSETGYQFLYQQGTPSAVPLLVRSHFFRFYLDGKKVLRKGVIGRFWIEILPDLTDAANLNINFEPSLSVVINEHFSLKMAFEGKYDGRPATATAKTFDFVYTTSLVASL